MENGIFGASGAGGAGSFQMYYTYAFARVRIFPTLTNCHSLGSVAGVS